MIVKAHAGLLCARQHEGTKPIGKGEIDPRFIPACIAVERVATEYNLD